MLFLQPEKALGMLGFMEKSLFGNGKSNQHTPDKELKESGKDDKNKDSGKDSGNSDGNGEMWKSRISQVTYRHAQVIFRHRHPCPSVR